MMRLTRNQVREIDRRAIEEYHIPGIVLMENAARAVVDQAMSMLHGVDMPEVLIVCGSGNNGGDGLAVARHLHNRDIRVILVPNESSAKYTGDAAINWKIVEAMKLDVGDEDGAPLELYNADLVIDALFGTGLRSPPRDTWLIDVVNEQTVPVLSIDLPSGLDCDTGEPLGACVRATRTITFVAEKAGFANPVSKQYTGEVIVGDIGCPRELVEEVAKLTR